ncbi:hypothetical protein A2U01_0060663, partial [Trifolium medium]|nr:hypothetical protein [Trifolium medium]
MEKSPTYSQKDGDLIGKNVLEKVIVGQSPKLTRLSKKVSSDSSAFGGMVREIGPEFPVESPMNNSNYKKDYFSQSEDHSNLKKVDNASEGDDTSDRIYTIDSVHSGAPYNGFT